METPLDDPITYTCERDGYQYTRRRPDYPPFLCPRCTRFLAKGVVKLNNQIQPPTHNPKEPEI